VGTPPGEQREAGVIRVDSEPTPGWAPDDDAGGNTLFADRERLAKQLALIVHELRSPLAATSQAIGLLERRSDQPPDPQVLGIARRQIELGLRRVEQLLVVLRDDVGPSTFEPTPQPLREVVLASTEQEPLIHDDSPLVVEIDPSLWVPLDRDAFAHVVENLVSNAVRHAPSGTAVVLRAEADDEEVRLRVIDQGPGMDTEVLGRAFEPFVRGEGGGAGLGLTVVRQVIEAHGGRVWVEIDPEAGGTSVVVALPRVPPSAS
jgi:signal transduction histidine kinase